jgi:uncharacterized protein
MKILLMSDTHGFLDDSIISFIKDCDQVWHCGDFGSIQLVEEIKKLKPLYGVFGNVDGQKIRGEFPETHTFLCEGLKICMRHIGGYPPRYEPGVRDMLKKEKPGVFISGHSHILKVIRDKDLGLIHMNPGAAGLEGFHKIRTLLRFNLRKGEIKDLQAIELGKKNSPV